jgi:hypothetical protein
MEEKQDEGVSPREAIALMKRGALHVYNNT